MSVKKITKDIKPVLTSSIQLWHGENQSLLSVELVKWINIFRNKYPQAKVLQLDCEQSNETKIVEALHQIISGGSLFSQRILIVLHGVLTIDIKSQLAGLIEQAFMQKSSELVMILVENKKVLWSKALAKTFKKAAESGELKIKEFKNLSITDIELWILDKTKRSGGKISSSAARHLATVTGNDFWALDNQIAKLMAWRKGEEIIVADIDLLVSPKTEDDIFSFIEAVGRRDIRLAQWVLNRQFNAGTSPQSLVGLLAWQLRVLGLIRQALDNSQQRMTPKQLANTLNLHPFIISKALQQIPYYSAERIAWLYGELSSLDIRLKNSRTEPEVLFSLFLNKLNILKSTDSQ